MPLTDLFEDDILDALFTDVAAPNVGDATGLDAGTTGNVELSLATVAYVDGDTLMTADECDYTGYSRPNVARSTAGWTVASGSVTNDAAIQFGEKTGGADDTAVHMGLKYIATGDSLQYHGDLASDLAISNGVEPQFVANTGLTISVT